MGFAPISVTVTATLPDVEVKTVVTRDGAEVIVWPVESVVVTNTVVWKVVVGGGSDVVGVCEGVEEVEVGEAEVGEVEVEDEVEVEVEVEVGLVALVVEEVVEVVLLVVEVGVDVVDVDVVEEVVLVVLLVLVVEEVVEVELVVLLELLVEELVVEVRELALVGELDACCEGLDIELEIAVDVGVVVEAASESETAVTVEEEEIAGLDGAVPLVEPEPKIHWYYIVNRYLSLTVITR